VKLTLLGGLFEGPLGVVLYVVGVVLGGVAPLSLILIGVIRLVNVGVVLMLGAWSVAVVGGASLISLLLGEETGEEII
jgi:hypothetical protein